MLTVYPPAIPFIKKKTKEPTKADKSKYIAVEVPLGNRRTDKATEWFIPVFDDGTPEEWIKWRIQFDNLVEQFPLETADRQFTMLRPLLKGRALDTFLATYPTELADLTEEEKQQWIKDALKAVSKGVFNDDASAWRRQRNYMRYHISFEVGGLKEFYNRLYEINKYLKYFPVPPGRATVTSLE